MVIQITHASDQILTPLGLIYYSTSLIFLLSSAHQPMSFVSLFYGISGSQYGSCCGRLYEQETVLLRSKELYHNSVVYFYGVLVFVSIVCLLSLWSLESPPSPVPVILLLFLAIAIYRC